MRFYYLVTDGNLSVDVIPRGQLFYNILGCFVAPIVKDFSQLMKNAKTFVRLAP